MAATRDVDTAGTGGAPPDARGTRTAVPSGARVSSVASPELDPTEADRDRRVRSARALSLTLVVLTAAVTLSVVFDRRQTGLGTVQAVATLLFAIAHAVARTGRLEASVALMIGTMVTQHCVTLAPLAGRDADSILWYPALYALVAVTTLQRRGVVLTATVTFATMLWMLGHRAAEAGSWAVALSDNQAALVLVTIVNLLGVIQSGAAARTLADQTERHAERTRARREREELEEHYRLVSDLSGDLVGIMSPDGNYVFASPSYERVLGVSRELLGKPTPQLVVPEDLPLLADAFRNALAGQTSRTSARLVTAGGEPRWFDVVLGPIEYRGGRAVAFSARDSTEHRRLLEELNAARRLELVGRLAGGVAHDFNNLLLVVRAGAHLAMRTLHDDHPAHQELAAILDASERAESLTKKLLGFARRQPRVDGLSDCRAVIAELAELLGRLLGRGVTLELSLPDEPVWVGLAPVDLEQIVVNLAGNGRDAMPGGGRLRIAVATPPGGTTASIVVEDEGAGIPEDVLPRIFEPFFTTKPPGKGTGLGLATCREIVSHAGGEIAVDSARGRGTRFTVTLPRVAAPPQAVPDAPFALRGACVVVAEDDPTLRRIMARVLGDAGAQVSSYANANEVLAHLAARPADLLVSDVMLGSDDGIELSERVIAMAPSVAIVLVSGYAPDPGRLEAVTRRGAVFLPKPFDPDTLLQAVTRAGAEARRSAPRRKAEASPSASPR